MKIFCINSCNGVNHTDFNDWYILPDSTILRSNNPFFIPEFDSEFTCIPYLSVRIDRLGKNIASKFASRYYSEATISVCVVAKNLLARLRGEGKSWSRAVAFDRSCLMGNFVGKSIIFDSESIAFSLGDADRIFNLAPAIASIDDMVSIVSSDNTLKTGDIVMVGLDCAGIPLKIGENLRVKLGDKDTELLRIRIR